jgi:hypothetical protein
MALIDEIRAMAASTGADLKEKKGVFTLSLVVAERKAFLSRKRLEYVARFRLDEAARELHFTEMLEESGSGVSGGVDDASPGFGFKAGTYRTGAGPREGSIAEQSDYFGKRYDYCFDWGTVRGWTEQAARAAGYGFVYHIAGLP